jgi:hypothetical protein
MPEYLAPGVFIEEVSFRSKSIEGVSTTTTGFVGPTRYGPVEIEPEIITNVTEFERTYGDGKQLNYGSSDGTLHNYLWHGVRAFFEEGGKRLYVARVFRPSVDPDNIGYVSPPEHIEDDKAGLDEAGEYGTDGHARVWLTKATSAVSAAERAVSELATGVQGLSVDIDKAGSASDWEAAKAASAQSDLTPLNLANKVVSDLGLDADSGLNKLLKNALTMAAAAKLEFPASKIGLGAFTTAKNNLQTAADRANFSLDTLSLAEIIVKAADDAKGLTTVALNALNNLETSVNVIILPAGTASAGLKLLATNLSNLCKDTTGDAWKIFNASMAKASDAATVADAANDTPVDRGKILVAVKAAVLAANATLAQKDAIVLAVGSIVARALTDGVTDPVLKGNLADLSAKAALLIDATNKALLGVQRSAYPRAYALSDVATLRDALLTSLNLLVQDATQTLADVKGGPRPPTALTGAALLRGRFPGSSGNTTVRIVAQTGQNVLVVDPADTSKSKLRGVLPGDLVNIGKIGGLATLYLAYPTPDGKDWYFSTDGKIANAILWLNNLAGQRLVPVTDEVSIVTADEVSIVTARIDVIHANGSIESWPGLAFQAGHTRNGAADSISEKFSPKPKNGNDARTLPIAILLDPSVNNGYEVFRALLERNPADTTNKDAWPISATHHLEGGNDGKRPGAAEYAGRGEGPDAAKTGLKAFEDVEDISIVAAPGAMFGYMNGFKTDAQQIVSSLISHAENMKYRIAVLESGEGQGIADVREMRARYDSKYAALYYPWVRVLDPITRDEINLPPSGFVAGIYARNDIDRAVYKAPANEVVRGAIGFQSLINKAQQEVLNPEGVNCFRFFEGRGFRLWGARTISSDPEWKYVNVRRYFAYLERSIDRGTQWAVFEPNGEALWANVKETISDFLYNEWKNGALLGSDAKSAYFVRCDRSTMTQNDLDNGRLVCKIGVAALKPAEFVIFQIGQWTGDRKA